MITASRLTQSLLLKQTFVSGELTKDQILICIPLILLDKQVVGGRHWIVLIVADLLDKTVEVVKELEIRRRLHLLFNLVEYWDVIFAYDHTIELALLQLHVPRMRLDILDVVSLLWIDLHDMLHHVFGLFVDVTRDEVLT